jgi:tRNA(fMet)-specific endonuclease VapC
MSTFLLDTTVFAALAKPTPNRRIVRAFEKHEDALVTAALAIHEMWFGILRLPPSKKRDHLNRFMNDVVGGIRVLPYGERAARWHAAERVRLTAAGRPPPFIDGQIAAIAAVHDAAVVTANVTHFEPFENLRVVNWSV